ncbi:hypothetical protein PV04_07165 [Phialophora macrospora]|uniref:Uncharacterized protein n=1 Tax=Phialophora macrospora TaxID=1851006 RepID=A0A0D2FD94_9EURO|nr:hypothetical protein PV04_07165 [Phialophora macrospora]
MYPSPKTPCPPTRPPPMDVPSPNMNEEPVFIGSTRLNITRPDYLPPDMRGCYSDGIEYYCCCNKDCDTAWAIQWTPRPRRKLPNTSVSLHTYKTFAVSKICARCEEANREADEEQKNQFEESQTKQEQAALKTGKGKGGEGILIKLVDKKNEPKGWGHQSSSNQQGDYLVDLGLHEAYKPSRKRQTAPMVLSSQHQPFCPLCWEDRCCCDRTPSERATVAKAQARLRTTYAFASGRGSEGVEHRKEMESVIEKMTAQMQRIQRALEAAKPPPAAFDEVGLSPPSELIEDVEMLAAKDPSWDVVVEADANEDWAIINHFGSIAIERRDAHVDTPTIRP